MVQGVCYFAPLEGLLIAVKRPDTTAQIDPNANKAT